jgi:hypothetical protein
MTPWRSGSERQGGSFSGESAGEFAEDGEVGVKPDSSNSPDAERQE